MKPDRIDPTHTGNEAPWSGDGEAHRWLRRLRGGDAQSIRKETELAKVISLERDAGGDLIAFDAEPKAPGPDL